MGTLIRSIGTYLPPWGVATARRAGDDEDVVTMAVAAGLEALAGVDPSGIGQVMFVSRDLPLLQGGNSAPLLAGLGLGESSDIREILGGAPEALAAVAGAAPGTLVVAADTGTSGAGAAAVLVGSEGGSLDLVARVTRSLPVVARDSRGKVSDYSDPRLLRVRGLTVSLEHAGVAGKVSAVAGLNAKEGAALADGDAPVLPTSGASSALFGLAALAEGREGGRLLAVEQASVAVADISNGGAVAVSRNERPAQPLPVTRMASDADIAISLAAYERAFEAKLRLEATRCTTCGTLAYPARYRCLGCGSEERGEAYPLPRDAEVYTLATIHVPVPGLGVPYTVVLVELGDSGVRVLVRLTGAAPGSAAIGDRGWMVLRKVATRNGVPDYGYAFIPELAEVPS